MAVWKASRALAVEKIALFAVTCWYSYENEAVVPSVEGSAEEPVFAMKKNVWRAVVEVGFIVFLFYSNLLLGEFERSGIGQKKGVAWATRFLPCRRSKVVAAKVAMTAPENKKTPIRGSARWPLTRCIVPPLATDFVEHHPTSHPLRFQ
jgi:hypothetical protein